MAYLKPSAMGLSGLFLLTEMAEQVSTLVGHRYLLTICSIWEQTG